jgi:hypothetical protein
MRRPSSEQVRNRARGSLRHVEANTDGANLVQAALNRWLVSFKAAHRTRAQSKALQAEMRRLGQVANSKSGADTPGRSTGRGRGKSARSLALVDAASRILSEIHPASVRAVCYRLFAAGLIPSMAKASTARVSKQLTWARERGVIPWNWIVDETREAERVAMWADPTAFIETVQRSYRRDRWRDQPHWLEVWSEKGTIRGTLAPVLHNYGVTFRVMHGFASSTAVHQIAEETQQATKPLTILYVGDWDPSGLHMSALDLPSRLARYHSDARLIRLALADEDLATLPSFPVDTKRGDPRYRWFAERFGSTCWELDALSPVLLRDRVERAIVDRLDQAAWDRAGVAESAECESLEGVLKAWPGISVQVSKCPPQAGSTEG